MADTGRRDSDLELALRQSQEHAAYLQRELDQARALNATLELLALVASKTENAVLILGCDQRIEWVNDSFGRLTGRVAREVMGATLHDVLYLDRQDLKPSRQLQQALDRGTGITQEILQVAEDGRTYWAAFSVTPVFNDAGVLTRWIGIASDITQRRRAEEALHQAKEQAELASRAKDEFLASISHELRTPMNAIIGMTELSLETTLSDEQREYLTTILDSAESLLKLLNDILDLSKIESRKATLEKRAFSLAEMLRATVKPFRLQAKQIQIDLQCEIASDLPEAIVGDPARLRQILTNLLSNAIKFTSAGHVRLTVRMVKHTKRRAHVCFEVADSGIGIPQDKLRHIFQAFGQADSSTSRRFGGTGLGLTISAQLVRWMGGTIRAQSTVGVGSTFSFDLSFPLARVLEMTAGAEHSQVSGERASDQPMSILVVDDNRANRSLAAKILQKRAHVVEEVDSGQAAIDRLAQAAFDIVLLDVQMPEMDGYETAKRIRSLGDKDSPYIIALTAHAMSGDRQRCLAAGMNAYLAKPVRVKQLLAIVDAVAAGTTASQEASLPTHFAQQGVTFQAALDRLEGDHELLSEQIEFFREDSPILMRDICQAIEQLDGHQLQLAAHRLRGLSASFDANDVFELATQLERLASYDIGAAGPLVIRLQAAWLQLMSDMEQFLSRRQPQSGRADRLA